MSFHSLEDRLVKRAFADRQTWERLSKKPITAGDEELAENPRARSAKLRAAQRVEASGGGGYDDGYEPDSSPESSGADDSSGFGRSSVEAGARSEVG